MMKTLQLLVLALFTISISNAQNDTILYENFDVDPTAGYALFNSGNDTVWVNFDADALQDANGRPQEWFWDAAGVATVDLNDGCLYSSSWLTGFLPGNRNWLITPPLTISDASAMLHWSSAPFQTPRYVDGYTVMVSTTDNLETSFTDTLFQAAQYISGGGSDWAAYVFSPGFVHGLDGTYIEFSGDSGAFNGEQRPFTASLAAYAGQTIYITFLHDADDDNIITIDDILVTGTLVGINENASDIMFSVFPNPASNKIELSYSLKQTGPVSYEIFDNSGRKVMSATRGIQIAGDQKLAVDITSLAKGIYEIMLNVNGSTVSSRFVKE